MAIISSKKRALLVRNDFILYEVDFDYDSSDYLMGIQKNYAI
jgi:hypothetical protein